MEKEKGKKKGFFSTLLRRKSTGGGQGAKAKAAAAGGGGGAGPVAASGGGGGGDEAGPVGRLPSADAVGAAAAGEGAGPADDLKVRIHTRLRAHSSAAYSHKIHLAMQHRRTRVSASGDRERPVQSSRIMRRLRPSDMVAHTTKGLSMHNSFALPSPSYAINTVYPFVHLTARSCRPGYI